MPALPSITPNVNSRFEGFAWLIAIYWEGICRFVSCRHAKMVITAGPCKPDIYYMLSATDRLPEIKQLIVQENYFVIHALRQVGKTTAMLSLAQELTASGHYNGVEGVG